MTITEFEQRVLDQRQVQAGHYDVQYYTGDWRAEGNNYSLERRREIEARNPALIKEVFQPVKALDLGCGPGALMHLLWELGVDCDGIDFSESSRRLATPQVRDRITVGVVTDPVLKPANAYDLVICREVLEHLTVLQVRRAVANIVRMTSRFCVRHDTVSSQPRVAARLYDPVRRRSHAHHAAEQGLAAAGVCARRLSIAARSRGADGLGR